MNPTYEYDLNSLPASDLVPDNLDTSSEDYHRQFQSASSNLTRDHGRYPPCDTQQLQHQQQQPQQLHQQVDNISSFVALYDAQEINLKKNGFKCPKWNLQEDENGNHHSNSYPMKWMSSKMRLTQKMRNYTDWEAWEIPSCDTALKFEDQTQSSSSAIPFGRTDMISSNNSSKKSNNNPIIRVCADCNTTKTPLWRSGPKGPRSLCNACGIRQRKARRAMAAAAVSAVAAKANDQLVLPTETSAVKTQAPQHKEKLRIKNRSTVQNNKKRIKLPVGSSSSLNIGQKKPCFEDFLTSLRKSLSFHQVFPQDEKEAAILLMALSSGLVLG